MSEHHTVKPTEGPHSHTIIFLHGRDSDAREFADEFFESQASDDRTLVEIFPTVKWVFPSSGLLQSSRFETELSQWFDMWSVENPQEQRELQLPGMKASVRQIIDLVKKEVLILGSADKIILAGISQGCATAIYALLCGGMKIGGFIGLSSWLPFHEEILDIANMTDGKIACIQRILDTQEGNDTTVFTTPIFLSHSRDDEVVPVKNGQLLCAALEDLNFQVRWSEYMDGGHWINEPQGVDDMVKFIQEVALL